jgi:hypothetical protein
VLNCRLHQCQVSGRTFEPLSTKPETESNHSNESLGCEPFFRSMFVNRIPMSFHGDFGERQPSPTLNRIFNSAAAV